jgi:GntR family transcriptional regulator, transcriptional repressor for pyruvate dehydrogenase complex
MSAAATQLRSIISAKEDGAFLGDELEVQSLLRVSRTTLRQVARLLEREGLLVVRRGSHGGYYACRPSIGSVETAVTAYLESLDVRGDELSTMASIIWIELVRQAAGIGTAAMRTLSRRLAKQVGAVADQISHHALSVVEEGFRAEVCAVVDSPYVRFIFRVNVAFAERRFDRGKESKEPTLLAAHEVAAWRQIKLLELDAIARGDPEMGVLAAQRTRRFWRSVSHLSGSKPCTRVERDGDAASDDGHCAGTSRC